VILLCAVMMGIGTAVGGWRIIKTMGLKLTKLEPVQGFAAETGAAMTIELASRFGIPLSTTHTISTSIMGVGATRRFSAVRWGVSRDIVIAWILTFPVCGFIAWGVALLLRFLA
jgi:PiT family inorganic phosphate transporter